MDRAIYLVMTGASHTLQAQAANSHNLANASTVGFKADLSAARSERVAGGQLDSRVNALLEDRGWDPTQGHLQSTGRDLDIALHHDAWLAVIAPDGTEAYSRNGSLKLTAEGQLVNAGGHAVLGEGGPVAIPPASSISIGADGTISVVPEGQSASTVAVINRLRVVQAGAADLERGADGLMRAAADVELQAKAGDVLSTGMLESSNVNPTEALVQMIELARQFELQVKVMKTAEENERSASTLSRLNG